MSTMKTEEYVQRTESTPEYTYRVTTYRIGGKYHCTVDNVDPGAVIARSEGPTREEAESKAVSRARERLRLSLAAVRFRQGPD